MARKTIRRSQVITPFGIGAIVDFPGQSLIAAGLDVWPPKPECSIYEDRLARRLSVQFFRLPPPGPREGLHGNYLPFIRFPLWYFCPRCRTLSKTLWNEPFPPKCESSIGIRFKTKSIPPCSSLPERKRWRMVPVRFVVACKNGHIDDFPWLEWAHTRPGQPLDEAKICSNPTLRFNYTGKSGLMGLLVKCENCDAKARSLMGSAGPNSLKGWKCTGNRPWLGPDSKQDCDQIEPPIMLQRGSTNLYFPKIASSILIPPFCDPIRKIIDDPHHWTILSSGVQENGSPDESRLEMFAEMKRIDFNRLKEVVAQKLTGAGIAEENEQEEEFRYSEYRALSNQSNVTETEFVTKAQVLGLYQDDISHYFEKIVLVEKLAETRALTGFSRIDPPPYREFDRQDQAQLSLQPQSWLPAVRVYGEGIFLQLKKTCIDDWSEAEVIGRYKEIIVNHQQIYQKLGRSPRWLPPKFFLLHSLAHVLIRRLSYVCGYGSSSIRERIYCWDDEDKDMSGILIYTAAGDCEGTMGGLVLQGKPGRFESLLLGALEDALWCSSDPLCIESRGQGIDSLNRAACHACALLPETSCEEGNRFLDRVALTGTPNNPDIGFFKELVKQIKTGNKT